jgi:xanthine dehydrogenase accessory factor
MTAGLRAVVRGGGEMASACARLLFLAGARVVVLERAQPLAVRRLVSFAEAVFAEAIEVEGVTGRLVAAGDLGGSPLPFVAVVVDPEARSLGRLGPDVVVDGRMAKRDDGVRLAGAALRIGLGPGFVAGEGVDAVVETQRGPDLGRVIWSGSAEPDTALPSPVLGFTGKRVLRAPRAGTFVGRIALGTVVLPGDVVGEVDGEPLATPIAGLLRGILHSGVRIEAGAKAGDVDPRGPGVDPARLSDKARAVAAGTLEAVLMRRLHLR